MDTQHFDAIVVGSGQGGTPLVKAMAQHGWRTALIERRWIGGTCVNVGCTPTKTMVASARVAYLARRAQEFGVHTGDVQVSMPEVIARKRDLVEKSRKNGLDALEKTENLTVLFGAASFTAPGTLAVALNDGGTQTITAPRIFLDVGVRTAMPPIPGLDQIPTLNNETIMELDAVPEHLAILGGGYIALEFAQMFRRFGSAVTIIQHGPHLAEQEDPDVSDEIAKILTEDGIAILLDSTLERAEQGPRNQLSLTVRGKTPAATPHTLAASHLLIAAGRTPNTDTLNADRVGLVLDRHGFLTVNDHLETSLAGVWAIGDCKGGPEFTHISYDDFRVLRDNLLSDPAPSQAHTIANRPLPYTMFTDPELGRIGLTETAARKAGRDIRVAKMPMTSVARARETGETRGFLKAIVDRKTDQILGATMLAENGGELATMIQIAMMGNVTASQLREGIWSHPTWSEALNNLFTTYEGESK